MRRRSRRRKEPQPGDVSGVAVTLDASGKSETMIDIQTVDHIGIRVADLDRNVIELRGREEDLSRLGGVERYQPEN